MNKIILIIATLLFSTGAFALGCNDGSLGGRFSYEVTGVDQDLVNSSTHSVGQVTFDGAGNVTLSGVRTSAGGNFVIESGTGTYTVNPDCSAIGDIENGTLSFVFFLDQMDNVLTPNKAYHATIAVSDNDSFSGSGSLTRLVGNFQ